MPERHTHWEKVYATKAETDVSWFQPRSEISLSLIEAAAPDKAAGIIDIGGGASNLIDDLIERSYSNLSVLDISEAALGKSKQRLGAQASQINWIAADVTQWQPPRRWGVWHDRAAFHFLTRREDQDSYVSALVEGTLPGAFVIISTFALDGPEKCSGLPVHRYSAETLAARLGAAFELVEDQYERHRTPSGSIQNFVYAMFKKAKGN